MTTNPPAEIAKAICEVSKQIGTLGKNEDNKFAGYKYVSVDKFFDVLGRLMAKEGIFVFTNETSTSVERAESTNPKTGEIKLRAWLAAKYEIFLCHESGAMWGPINRDIRVEATGPQAYGTAASYVEKYFLRSLFKVPTGERDIDGEAQEGLPSIPAPPVPPPPQQPLPRDWKFDFAAYRANLMEFNTLEDIDGFDAKVRAKYGKQMSVADHEEADAILRECSSRLDREPEPAA